MKLLLTRLVCVTFFFSVCSEAMSQNVPLRVDMNYTQARKVLLDNGWLPFIPTGALRLACDGKSDY